MKSTVELTATARRHAETRELLALLEATPLPLDLIGGDIVEVSTPAGAETFVVHRRRLRILSDGSRELVFELDYPAGRRS